MTRPAAVLCVLAIWGCSDNPYVIGRHVDAGRPDAGRDAGVASECDGAHADALLCSGFEQPNVAAGLGDTVIVNAGELERSTALAHSGESSLHASSRAMMSVAVVRASFPAMHSGAIFVRAYLYVPADLPTQIMNIFFVGDTPVPDPFLGLDFNLNDGAVELFTPQNDPQRYTGELTIPRNGWFCFRARTEISDTDGLVQAFVDDQLALEVTGIDTLPPEGVRLFRAGVDWSSAQDAFFEIYLDDLVLDTAPVPCL
jgi:hypothetical protein